jgi:hypothetical protein
MPRKTSRSSTTVVLVRTADEVAVGDERGSLGGSQQGSEANEPGAEKRIDIAFKKDGSIRSKKRWRPLVESSNGRVGVSLLHFGG